MPHDGWRTVERWLKNQIDGHQPVRHVPLGKDLTMRLAISRRRTAMPALLAFSLLTGGAAAGCSGAAQQPAATATTQAAAAVTIPMGDMVMPTAEQVDAAWKARPDYVKALPDDWQAAYRFALERPDVVQWMPCNCGCAGQGHRSNLDCFFDRRETGQIQFQEHGSFCDICVRTANLASKLLREGKSATEIRAAVDAQFGGGGHGTDTPLPPA